jgi:hypothetical protein
MMVGMNELSAYQERIRRLAPEVAVNGGSPFTSGAPKM